jgi:acetylornithine deacetylase/succinyl-diaminopimelate desuccinylase-like protein
MARGGFMASETLKVPFTAQQEQWFNAASQGLDAARVKRLIVDLVNIHSPTGAERQICEFMADYLAARLGGRGHYQTINEMTGNVFGEVKGSGGGASLMLYAPIDTHLEGEASRDIPWAATASRADLLPKAMVDGDLVIGLGAANPKAMVATLTEVAVALFEAGVPILGDLMPAFAGGGMSVDSPLRGHYGLGDGVYHMISRGVAADLAIIMKPIWAVYAEEPGLCWFKVSVRGTMCYSGSPRGVPGDRNSILPAAALIPEIDQWIQQYSARNAFGTLTTEGKITAVRAGWLDRFAYSPATTEIYLDVRCTPRMALGDVRAQFAEGMSDVKRRHPEIDFDWEMIAALPGGSTDPDSWIVQSCRRGWERVEGRPHGDPPRMSGRTDGSLIRKLGIPTARIGFPAPPENCPQPYKEGLGGMGVVYVPDLMKTARAIMYAVIDTLTRPRREVIL